MQSPNVLTSDERERLYQAEMLLNISREIAALDSLARR